MIFTLWISQGSTTLRKILLDQLHMLFRCQVPGITKWGIHLLSLAVRDASKAIQEKALRVTALFYY